MGKLLEMFGNVQLLCYKGNVKFDNVWEDGFNKIFRSTKLIYLLGQLQFQPFVHTTQYRLTPSYLVTKIVGIHTHAHNQ